MPTDPIPDDAQASPLDAPWLVGCTTWYKPTWSQTASLLGWRWSYFAPALLLTLLLIFVPRAGVSLLIYGWKLIIFAVAIPLIAFGAAARGVIRNRKDPFCIHCGYSLTGLPDAHRCPECGQPYLFRIIDEYRNDPAFFIQRLSSAHTHPIDHLPFQAGTVRSRKSRDGT